MIRFFTLTFCALFTVGSTSAQYIDDPYFDNTQTILCATDTTDTTTFYRQFLNWEVYQTLDSTWNGPRDSNCLNLWEPGIPGQLLLELDNIDPNLPLYIRAVIDPAQTATLNANDVLRSEVAWLVDGSGTLSQNTNCPDGLCSGTIVQFQIPDSAGTGDTIRQFERPYTVDDDFITCLPSEKFQDNRLKEFIIVMQFDNLGSGDILTVFSSEIHRVETTQNLDGNNINSQRSGTSSFVLSSFSGNYLVVHPGNSYPTASNMAYLDLEMQPNSTQQDTVTLTVEQDASLIYEPFTELRAGLVQNDTIRHHLEIDMQGGTLCFPWFLDISFTGGGQVTYGSGKLDLAASNSCLAFGDGGTLKIENGSHLVYGERGRGLLMLQSDANVEIGRNATLEVRGQVILMETTAEEGYGEVGIVLNESSSLVFAPGSIINNNFSKDRSMTLDVYMQGGTIDLSGLDPQSRSLVNIIYEDPPVEDALVSIMNPVQEEAMITLDLKEDQPVHFRVYSMSGQQLVSETQPGRLGTQHFFISTINLHTGIYLMEIQVGDQLFAGKFMKL